MKAYIDEFHMVEKDEHVLVGFSGGADSVCLLHVLWALKEELHIQISAVHINHQLRENAERDAAFAEAFCEKLGIPFYLEVVDVSEYAQKGGLSIEEAAREVRFDAFSRVAEKNGATKIALAHHFVDQAETILFRLCRGAGLRGLRGIMPVRDNVIHPLLGLTKEQILQYIHNHQLDYVTDETNYDDAYTRNRIRHHILPMLTEQISEKAVTHINETAAKLRAAQDYLQQTTQELYQKYCVEENKTVLISDALCQEHGYLIGEVILQAMEYVANGRKDILGCHVEAISSLFEKQVGRQVDLPYGLSAKRVYQGIRVAAKQENEVNGFSREFTLEERKQIITDLPDGKEMIIRVFPYEETLNIPQNQYTKWFDYDRINEHLVIRYRQSGDFFMIDEEHSQKVKSYFINEKIPADERNNVLLLCENEHVIWMIGYRISNYYKVTKHTKKILEITIRGGSNNG